MECEKKPLEILQFVRDELKEARKASVERQNEDFKKGYIFGCTAMMMDVNDILDDHVRKLNEKLETNDCMNKYQFALHNLYSFSLSDFETLGEENLMVLNENYKKQLDTLKELVFTKSLIEDTQAIDDLIKRMVEMK